MLHFPRRYDSKSLNTLSFTPTVSVCVAFEIRELFIGLPRARRSIRAKDTPRKRSTRDDRELKARPPRELE